jgi:hypothetical protein
MFKLAQWEHRSRAAACPAQDINFPDLSKITTDQAVIEPSSGRMTVHVDG